MRKIWKIHSQVGGGLELVVVGIVSFMFCSRAKFFYFLTMFTIDKAVVSYIKLAYMQPRPYMVNPQMVKAYQCPKEFGSPSGHSSGAMAFSVVMFLDQIKTGYTRRNMVIGVLLLYWALIIPYTRIVMGAHSFDQILFGSSIGLWNGLTCHFVLRDGFIRHVGLIQSQAKKASGELIGKQKVINWLAIWVGYLFVSYQTYKYVDNSLETDNQQSLALWKKNYVEQKCGKTLPMTYALHNGSYTGCGILTFHIFIYVFMVYRHEFTDEHTNIIGFKKSDSGEKAPLLNKILKVVFAMMYILLFTFVLFIPALVSNKFAIQNRFYL